MQLCNPHVNNERAHSEAISITLCILITIQRQLSGIMYCVTNKLIGSVATDSSMQLYMCYSNTYMWGIFTFFFSQMCGDSQLQNICYKICTNIYTRNASPFSPLTCGFSCYSTEIYYKPLFGVEPHNQLCCTCGSTRLRGAVSYNSMCSV